MLPDALFSEPGLPEPERQHRRLPAVAASVVLHAALLFALVRVAPLAPHATNDDSAVPALVVGIATRSPQRRSTLPTSLTTAEPEAATADIPTIANPGADSSSDNASPEDTTDPEPTPEATSGVQPARVLDRLALQNSISDRMANYRQDLRNRDLQECLQYRARYARWDCPQEDEVKSATRERIDESLDLTFRDWVSGYDTNARISRELVAEQSRLQPLMEDTGVLGALARERYSLIRKQYILLNPVPEAGGTITLVTFDLGGITIPNRLRIGLDGKIKSGIAVKAPARRFDED